MVKFDNTFENNLIRIGRDRFENDQIIVESKETDVWFHLKDVPSCHVIIACDIEHILTNTMIMHCARLVKENTNKQKNIPNIKVIYTEIKNVQRTKEPGLVTLSCNPKTIIV